MWMMICGYLLLLLIDFVGRRGRSPCTPPLVGVPPVHELGQGLLRHARAAAEPQLELPEVDAGTLSPSLSDIRHRS